LDGLSVEGTRLSLQPHHAEVVCQHYWDDPQHWRSTMRVGLERNDDNGTGYYDYWQYRAGLQLRYRSEKWEITLGSTLAEYVFDRQPISAADPGHRRRTSFETGVRAERSLSKHWKTFLAYSWERSYSNLEAERYIGNTGCGGFEFTF
jgi:hypothetical protein